MRSAFVTRPSVFAYVQERAKYLAYAGAVFDRAVAGTLTLRIGGAYPLATGRGRTHRAGGPADDGEAGADTVGGAYRALSYLRQTRLAAVRPGVRRDAAADHRRRPGAHRRAGSDAHDPLCHRSRRQLRGHRLAVSSQHQRAVPRPRAAGRLPRAGQAGDQAAVLAGQRSRRLRPFSGRAVGAAANRPD